MATRSLDYRTAMGKGTIATITRWGIPWTTGAVSVTAIDGFFITTFMRAGYDNRLSEISERPPPGLLPRPQFR
jgi:hypothetical protein